jgi:putative sterol carrier protein
MTISLQKPSDLISIALYNILSYKKDDAFERLVTNWNKTILLHIEPFYPVSVVFNGNHIEFEKESSKKTDLKIIFGLNTFLDIAYGRLSIASAFIKRKFQIKGLYKIGTVIRFYRVFIKTFKQMAKDPNLAYYMIGKDKS